MIWNSAIQNIAVMSQVPQAPPPPPSTGINKPIFLSPMTVIGVGAAARTISTLLRNPIKTRRAAILGRWGWFDE